MTRRMTRRMTCRTPIRTLHRARNRSPPPTNRQTPSRSRREPPSRLLSRVPARRGQPQARSPRRWPPRARACAHPRARAAAAAARRRGAACPATRPARHFPKRLVQTIHPRPNDDSPGPWIRRRRHRRTARGSTAPPFSPAPRPVGWEVTRGSDRGRFESPPRTPRSGWRRRRRRMETLAATAAAEPRPRVAPRRGSSLLDPSGT